MAHLHIVTSVEGLQIKLPVRLGSPKAQVDGVVGLKAWDGVVIRHSRHLHAHTMLTCRSPASRVLRHASKAEYECQPVHGLVSAAGCASEKRIQARPGTRIMSNRQQHLQLISLQIVCLDDRSSQPGKCSAFLSAELCLCHAVYL